MPRAERKQQLNCTAGKRAAAAGAGSDALCLALHTAFAIALYSGAQ